MAFALRKIDHKVLWDATPTEDEKSWLAAGQLRADALQDIATEGNELSVYLVEEEKEELINRIIGAIAANRERVDKVDYIIFDAAILAKLKITVLPTPGATLDSVVNDCHRDLVQLTATTLADLGNSMQRDGRIRRKQDKEVGRLINSCLKAGYMDEGRLAESIRIKLKDARYS
jgi:hypothetical protein